MTDKYLINCAYGSDNPEKATISFILAFTSSKANETAVFATAGALDLFLEKSPPSFQAAGYQPIKGLIDGYIENGGSIWICPACIKAKGLSQDDLIDGVEIAGGPKTMQFLATGGKTLA
jgi:predicted peroxiredoxin